MDGTTTLDTSLLHMLNRDGNTLPTGTIPSSVCAGRCDTCLAPGIIPIAFLEGDAYILGVFSLHNSVNGGPFECSQEFR